LSDNKQRRMQLQSAKDEAEELRSTNAAVVAQASTLEERVSKLQDEVALKSELAAMWRRSAEKGGGGGGDPDAQAKAVTWKLEAERAMREGERWKAVARRAEDAARQKDEDAMRLRLSLEEAKLGLEQQSMSVARRDADDQPLEDVRQALLSAQDDLQSKTEEASQLAAKVARLENALHQLM
jgi:chromosome segregation ATPase